MAVSINKNWLLLAGAIALGGLAFFLSNKAINSRISQLEEEATRGKTMVRVVVANRPLGAGELIDSSVVSVREIPSEFVNKTTIVPDTYDAVDGQALQVDVQRGEPLLTSYTASRGGEVFAAVIKAGRRALTLEVDEISSISGMLRPGDRIDLLLTARPPEASSGGVAGREVTFPMLSNIEVLATGQAQKAKPAAGEAAAAGFSHITLDVTPEESTRIIVAKTAGKLTAVLRSPGDRAANPSRSMTADDVVASLAPGDDSQRRMVEFIIGGASGGGGAGKVSNSPMLDAALQDPNNRAIAERVAATMSAPPQSSRNAGAAPAAPATAGTAPTQLAPGAAMPSPAAATGYVRR